MPQSFPCPNPVCSQVFTATEVQGAASLTCPRCGGIFQFRQPAKPISKPTTTKRPIPPLPTASVPLAIPVASPVPLATPVAPELMFDDPGVVVSGGTRRKRPHGKRSWLLPLLAGAAVLSLVVVGTVLAIIVRPLLHWKDEADQLPTFDGKALNFKYTLPGAPWKDDRALQLRMQSHLAMRRSNPHGGLALNARDYKSRVPDDDELLADALTILKPEFKGIEWEIKPRDADVTLGGQPCFRIEFVGVDPDEVRMNGYCYMLARRGYAYWFFTWAPDGDRDALQKESDRVRQGFTLLSDREGWTVHPPETFAVNGRKIHFHLDAVKGLWQLKPNREGGDPKADVVLTADYPGEKAHTGKMATFQALVLDKAESLDAATKAARDYLFEAEKEKQPDDTYLYPNAKIESLDDKSIHNTNDPVGDGATAGWLLKLRVEKGPDLQRYVVLRIVPQGDGVLVLWCECDYKWFTYWDLKFTALLDTLTMR